MFEILTVCTGNICRSPLAEQLLRTRLAMFRPTIASAGTRGLAGVRMTPEAQRLAVGLGVPPTDAGAHRSRFLTEPMLESPDLILTMTRDHRRKVAELAPARLRSTFTVREFARLIDAADTDVLHAAVEAAGHDPAARVRALGIALAGFRGSIAPPDDPAADDVIDPFQQSWDTYELSARQLDPAIDAVVVAVGFAAASGGALD